MDKAVYSEDILLKAREELDEESVKIVEGIVDNATPIIIPAFKNGIYIKQKAMEIIRELIQNMEANQAADNVPEDDILALKETYNIILQSPVEEPEPPKVEEPEVVPQPQVEEPADEEAESEDQEEEPIEKVEEEEESTEEVEE